MNINAPNGRLVLPWKKRHSVSKDDAKVEARLPLLKNFPRGFRQHFVATLGEFIGTFLFLFFAFAATQFANNTSTSGQATQESALVRILYISLAFGFSLAVNAWAFFRISGGLFNPAVTLGMCLIGALTWVRGALLVAAQLLAGMCAAAVVMVMFTGPLTIATQLNAGTSTAQGLFIEMFLTFELVFVIYMLAAEKHRATYLAPVGIGLALFSAELAGVFFTGGSLNPARSFGPCVASRSFPGYHWIYWLGPVLGTVLATLLYDLNKILEYETANPDQDDDGEEKIVVQDASHTNGSDQEPRSSTGNHPIADQFASVRGSRDAGYNAGPGIESGAQGR